MLWRSIWRRCCLRIAQSGFRTRRANRRWRPMSAADVLEERCLLSTITVTSLADNLTVGDGKITLREALQAANTNLSVDGSTAGQAGGQDTIVFQPGLAGLIPL